MKKIILGTLVLLTIGMGFGFAQTQKKNDTETKSKDYYEGYKQAANDYSKKTKNIILIIATAPTGTRSRNMTA